MEIDAETMIQQIKMDCAELIAGKAILAGQLGAAMKKNAALEAELEKLKPKDT